MSAIAASAIPNIFGGFAPFPNTIATALLAYQSEAIGYGFGIKFQAGKRTIGAMTNEQFNGLTEASLGAIVNKHNDELIGRMKLEMPKWIEIQQHYIEAGVTVEVMKANRTPSAWAEIITAFTGAAGQQIVASINGLEPLAKSSILSISPILAMIYYLSQNTGTSPPPDEEPEPGQTFATFDQNYDRAQISPFTGTQNIVSLIHDVWRSKNFTCSTLNTAMDALQVIINNNPLPSDFTGFPYTNVDDAKVANVAAHHNASEILKIYLKVHADNGCTQ